MSSDLEKELQQMREWKLSGHEPSNVKATNHNILHCESKNQVLLLLDYKILFLWDRK